MRKKLQPTTILDFDLTAEVDAVVAAAEYLQLYPTLEGARTALRDRAFHVIAERVTEAARHVAGSQDAPVSEIVAFAMAQTWDFISRRPEEARAFFRDVRRGFRNPRRGAP